MLLRYAAALVALAAAPALAQTVPPPPPVAALLPAPLWRTQGRFGLNANAAALSDNWKGGGVNTVGGQVLANVKASRKSGPHSFDNEADFLLAGAYTNGLGYRKGQDRLYLDTKYGHALNPKWDTFASLTLLTQWAPGYKYSKNSVGDEQAVFVSSFFAPAFVTMAYGFEYHPNAAFKVRLSPFSPRLTVVTMAERFATGLGERPYGVSPGHSVRWEVLAAQVLAEYDKNLSANVNLKARYVLFANYETLEAKKIDHRLDVALTAKAAKYLNVALTGIALYDYDQDKSIQYSQGLTLGLAYSFQNFVDEKK